MLAALLAAIALSTATTQEPAAGTVKKSARGDVDLVYIPSGEFIMGSKEKANEMPTRSVYLDGYWIGKYIVTVAQFREFCKAKAYKFDWQKLKPQWGWIDTHPMVLVTWEEARAYCKWAGGDLPTEAQWEKAARGTDGRTFPWGNRFDANKLRTNTQSTAPVGSYPAGASPFGCLDMAGNVYQWCLDFYSANYEGQPDKNPTGPSVGRGHILRGGDWGDDNRISFRCAYRYADLFATGAPDSPSAYKPGSIRLPVYGFRVAVPGAP